MASNKSKDLNRERPIDAEKDDERENHKELSEAESLLKDVLSSQRKMRFLRANLEQDIRDLDQILCERQAINQKYRDITVEVSQLNVQAKELVQELNTGKAVENDSGAISRRKQEEQSS